MESQLDAACARLERQAKERAAAEQAEYERKVAAREQRRGRAKGRHIKPPAETPKEATQVNLTDADSGLMRRNKRSEYQQAYNAQAVVDADGSQLVLGARVSQCASDRRELVADVAAVPEAVGTPDEVLADNGYATETEVKALTDRGLEVLVAVGGGDRRRQHDFRPESKGYAAERTDGALAGGDAGEAGAGGTSGQLSSASAYGGAGVRHHETRHGVPAVSPARA